MTQDDGPLSQLMAQADWSSTPLGPYRDWPPELRTAVSVCLNCPFLTPEQVTDHLSTRLLGDTHTDDVALLVYRQPTSG